MMRRLRTRIATQAWLPTSHNHPFRINETNSAIESMRIALVNTFPRRPQSPELEFIRKFAIAAIATGHQTFEVETSDEILKLQPDFVIAAHELSPKLTSFFTAGVIWKQPLDYMQNPRSKRSIRSYDAYLVGSQACREFLDSMEFATGIRKPRGNFEFLPSAPVVLQNIRKTRELSLCFIGMNSGNEERSLLLREIAAVLPMHVYGPEEGWANHADLYRGTIPFDGISVQETLACHGIALCLHSKPCRNQNIPSSRIFEAAAAGCLLIVDDLPFAKQLFGDSAFYIDGGGNPQETALEIKRIVKWANDHPEAAIEKRRRSREVFIQNHALERIVNETCRFVEGAKKERLQNEQSAVRALRDLYAHASRSPGDDGLVDVIMRTGGRDLDSVRRALVSLDAQTEGSYRVLLVDYKGRADVEELARTASTSRTSIEYVRCEDTGARSTSLWAGLNRVQAPFFANLDDDDTLAPDHFAGLLATAFEHPDHDLYYGGAIRLEEALDQYIHAENFSGSMPGIVKERRELVFLEPFNLSRLIATDNYITSNSFIARSSALDERALVDPHLIVAEDMYLLLMLARRRSFICNNRPTSHWHWRSTSIDNSMIGIQKSIWQAEGSRLLLRMDQEVFPTALTFGAMRLICKPGEEGAWKPPTPENQNISNT
ncbi:MAG: glycosyltransferase [Variovorax sp.]|nr:MAG: glycosyltransferase [Variovorax sp.]